jgi:hypothetical protein
MPDSVEFLNGGGGIWDDLPPGKDRAMAVSERFFPRGAILVVLLPFDSDLQIDEPAYRSHLQDVAAVEVRRIWEKNIPLDCLRPKEYF